jgi:hypothetical protein
MGEPLNLMPWHLQALAQRQKRVLAEIGPVLTRHGFYLAGGTAVALHLGHRRSVDFDWFTSEDLNDPLALAEDLREDGIPFITGQTAPGTLHGTVHGIQISLIRYRYPLLAKLGSGPSGIRIAAKQDLAAMKLSAIARRGTKKDFVDIYALGRRADSLQPLLKWYREKFATEDLVHVLVSLAYFDDAERERLPKMLWKIRWPKIKATIQRWIGSLS